MTADSPLRAPNPWDIAFPTLPERDIALLRKRGHVRPIALGEVLFAEGDRDLCFFVVLSGAIEIRESSHGEPRPVVVHHAGQFTGDIDTLTGRAALVTAIVIEPGEVVAMNGDEVRHAVDELADLGEVIVKAFLMRRSLLLDAGYIGVKIIGSRFSPDSHRLRDFATRNAIPYTWIDLESDRQADAFLQQFKVAAAETPLLIGPGGHMLKNP
jgi:thioredoxin reductase (NADPH)